MTGIVATAVALRRNVAWRGYSAISVIAAVAAFFFQFVLAFHQAPAHEIVCNAVGDPVRRCTLGDGHDIVFVQVLTARVRW